MCVEQFPCVVRNVEVKWLSVQKVNGGGGVVGGYLGGEEGEEVGGFRKTRRETSTKRF